MPIHKVPFPSESRPAKAQIQTPPSLFASVHETPTPLTPPLFPPSVYPNPILASQPHTPMKDTLFYPLNTVVLVRLYVLSRKNRGSIGNEGRRIDHLQVIPTTLGESSTPPTVAKIAIR